MVAMYRLAWRLSPRHLRRTVMFWLRLFSSTDASGQTLRISSSFSTVFPLCWTSARSVSNAFGVSCTGSPSRSSRRLTGSRRNGPRRNPLSQGRDEARGCQRALARLRAGMPALPAQGRARLNAALTSRPRRLTCQTTKEICHARASDRFYLRNSLLLGVLRDLPLRVRFCRRPLRAEVHRLRRAGAAARGAVG